MDFRLPELGEGVYEAEVVRWLVKPGEIVKRAQVLMEVLTDKATMEVPAPFAGVIDTLRAEPGQQVKVGDVILTYHEATAAASAAGAGPTAVVEPAKPQAAAPAPSARRAGNGLVAAPAHVKAAPSVRQLAHRLGIDLGQVVGSGPQGRILAEDLTKVIQRASYRQRRDCAAGKEDGAARFWASRARARSCKGLRRKIAEHMVQAKRTIPHYTYVDECDVTDLVKIRESLARDLAGKGVKLTYLPFFVKAVVKALKEVPIVNSSPGRESRRDRAARPVQHRPGRGHAGGADRAGDRQRRQAGPRWKSPGETERLSNEARAGKNRA